MCQGSVFSHFSNSPGSVGTVIPLPEPETLGSSDSIRACRRASGHSLWQGKDLGLAPKTPDPVVAPQQGAYYNKLT